MLNITGSPKYSTFEISPILIEEKKIIGPTFTKNTANVQERLQRQIFW